MLCDLHVLLSLVCTHRHLIKAELCYGDCALIRLNLVDRTLISMPCVDIVKCHLSRIIAQPTDCAESCQSNQSILNEIGLDT